MKEIIYKVHSDHIEFIEYSFFCASVYEKKILKAEDIVDATDKYFAPPAIRTTNGELIFVPFLAEKGGENEKLPFFYERNHITVRRATDIWGIINDPFLDTVHSRDYIRKGYNQLKACGISRYECNILRKEVAGRMLAYNSILWDWVHLGLYDVLCASLGDLSGPKYQLSNVDFEKFYWRAMEIAIKGFDEHCSSRIEF